MNRSIKCYLTLLSMLATQMGYAVCVPDRTFRIQNININMGRILVKPSDAIGKVLATQEFNFSALQPNSNSTYNCTPNVTSAVFQAELVNSPSLSSLGSKIYNTNIPGIGIRLKHNLNATGTIFTDFYPYSKTLNVGTTSSWILAPGHLGVEIIKTAQITGAGALRPGNYSLFTIDQNQASPWFYSVMNVNGTTIASSSCEILGDKNKIITLATVSKSGFVGVGTTVGETTFDLNIQCNGAVSTTTQTNTSMNMTIDFNAESNNINLLRNTAVSNAAQGVALQLILNNPGSERILGKGSQIDLGVVNSNQQQLINLPFKVRYYQSQATVVSGELQAQATVTFDYL